MLKKKLRVRSSAATEVTGSSKELGDQIARLMATLNRAEQGTHPATTPNSPRHRGQWERTDRQEYSFPPQLPQWSDWPGPKYFQSQLFCCT